MKMFINRWKNGKVCNKKRYPSASLLFKDQDTKRTTIKWTIIVEYHCMTVLFTNVEVAKCSAEIF